MKLSIKVKKLVKEAVIPARSTDGSAGFDFYAIRSCLIYPNESRLIKTGLSFEFDKSHAMLITPRSGLALKNSITVGNAPGLIDSDYRGEVGIILRNESSVPYKVHAGDRVAQGIIVEVPDIIFDVVDNLTETERSDSGFGSTGK